MELCFYRDLFAVLLPRPWRWLSRSVSRRLMIQLLAGKLIECHTFPDNAFYGGIESLGISQLPLL